MIKRPESYLVGRRSAEGLVPSFTAKWTGEHVTLTGMREDYAPDAAERRALLGHFNVGSLWELSGGGDDGVRYDHTVERRAGTVEHFHAAVFQLDSPFEKM